MYNISEKSKLYSATLIKKELVRELLNNDFSEFQIDMLLNEKLGKLETKIVYDFICENKDLTDKGINVILNDDVKLFLRIHTHKGTWYSDDYVPYCGQMQIKCSSPRMQLNDYGYKCPECKNEISFSGVRLTDSPLNKNLKPNVLPISMIHNVVITKDKYLQLDKLSKEGSYGNKLTKFNLVEDLLLLEDNSITDSDLIRAIALWGIENNSNMLNSKIKSELQFAGLYPNVMKAVSYDEVVENPEFKELVESISESGRNNLQMLKDAFKQKPIDSWLPLDQMLEHFKNSNNINIRIDTRDFGCMESKNNRFAELGQHTKDSIVKYFRRFMYTKDEVIECMENAFKKSGGTAEWRMLNYKNYPETFNWQLKYLNIIYIGNNIQLENDTNLQYIITSNDDRLLNKNMWNTEIDEELLCVH